jgi:tetratricopeptide (TPR) repeat protein
VELSVKDRSFGETSSIGGSAPVSGPCPTDVIYARESITVRIAFAEITSVGKEWAWVASYILHAYLPIRVACSGCWNLVGMEIQGAPRPNAGVSAFRVPWVWYRRAVVWCVGLVSAALLVREFSRPHALVGIRQPAPYDDGVYFGAALRLVSGNLPYRDFTFVHPPGLPIILSPIAALGPIVGEQVAMVIARLLTAVAALGVVVLGTWIVRYRGRVAMMTTGFALACFPLTLDHANSIVLETYYVMFCLLGTLALFGSTGAFTSSHRRTFVGGLAFGFACAIKVWALMPIVAVLAVYGVSCLRHKQWRQARWLIGGIMAGAAVPVVPFFALAPRTFVHDVVFIQLTRGASAGWALSIGDRFSWMTGLVAPGLDETPVVAVGVVLTLAIAVVVSYAMVGGRVALDWFILVGASAIVAGVCVPRQFYHGYGYLPGVFLALLLGVVVGRFARAVMAGRFGSKLNVAFLRRAAMAVLLIVAYVGALAQHSYARKFMGNYADFGHVLSSYIRPGACVVSDGATAVIEADRLVAARRCPATVDVYGQWLAANPAHPPPYAGPFERQLVRSWEAAMRQADYLVLVAPQTDFVPWTPQLFSYFWSHYALVYVGPGTYVFEKTTELNPKNLPHGTADRLVRAGISAQEAADTGDALLDCTAAARIDPRNARAHFCIGHIFQNNGNAVGAESEYKQTLAIDPRFGSALYNMGVLLTATRPAEAISSYMKDLRVDPGNAAADLNLGLLLIKHENTATQGRTYLRKAIQLNPAFRQRIPGIKL